MFLTVLVFLVSICTVALSVGAIFIAKTGNDQKSKQIQNISAHDVQVLENITEFQAATLKSLQNHYHELNNKMIELNNKVIQMQTENNVQELNRSVTELKAALESVRNESTNNELDLTAGCAATISSTCIINHNNVGTPPTYLSCETPEHPLEEPGFRNVNIYCSIDNSVAELNPVTSTLNIFNGEVSCLCSLVALTEPTASPLCRLTVQRCPDTISLLR